MSEHQKLDEESHENLPSPYDHITEEEEDNDGHGKGGHHSEGHSSHFAAGVQIINTIMGAGILSIPVVFRYLGIIFGTVFILVIAIVNAFSVKLLLDCRDMTGRNGYAMFAKITYGAAGSLFVKIIIIINNLGMCCAYFRIFGETAHNLAKVFVESDNFFANNWNNFFYVICIFVIMSVLIFKDNLNSLKSASFLGVGGITIFFISLVIIFFYKLSQGMIDDFDSSILWPSGEPLDIIGVLPTVFLAFTFQFNVFPVFFSLKTRTNKEMTRASNLALTFCCLIYCTTGFLGYYMYRLTLKDTILQALTGDVEKYKGSDSFLMVILVIINIAFLCSSTMSIPLMFFSLKNNFINSLIFCKKKFGAKKVTNSDPETKEKLMNTMNSNDLVAGEKSEANNGSSSQMSNTTRNIIIVLLYITIGVISIVVPGLKIIFNLVGSTAANSLSFILPNLFFLKLASMGKLPVNKLFPTILLVIGTIILLVCLVGEVIRLFK